MSSQMIPDTNNHSYWSVFAVDGDITSVGPNHDTAPSALMLLEGGVLRMEASVPAHNRTTAIAAARIAWRDLAANLEGGM